MARKVFFSFHHKRDSIRVSQIRECNSVTQHFTRTPFLPKSEWESIKRSSSNAIRSWIDSNMEGTSVVVLCYGLETYTRPWVKYELEKAHNEGRGIVSIDMGGMKNMDNIIDPSGINPLLTSFDKAGTPLYYYSKYKTYSWILNNGRQNIQTWIEEAAKLTNR